MTVHLRCIFCDAEFIGDDAVATANRYQAHRALTHRRTTQCTYGEHSRCIGACVCRCHEATA